MADEAERYCSDCAWPYECAEARSCHRRDMGEVRGESLAPADAGTVDPYRARAALRLQLSFGLISAEEYGEQVVETFRGQA